MAKHKTQSRKPAERSGTDTALKGIVETSKIAVTGAVGIGMLGAMGGLLHK